MKTSLLATALLFASVSLFGVAAGGGTVPPTPPTVPPTKTGCNKSGDKKPSTPKAPEKKKESEKKCDDSKRPFKK